MDHIILTVGRNELPVLVAAWRLCSGPALPVFTVLHSAETAGEAARVRTALEARLRQEGRLAPAALLDWNPRLVDEAEPPGIRSEIAAVIRKYVPRAPGYTFHLHHTGGTTAMGVYALQALLENRFAPGSPEARYAIESSYLAGKDQVIRAHSGAILTPPGSDERYHWNLTVEDLARLHGYGVACRPTPSAAVLDLSGTLCAILVDSAHGAAYSDWLFGIWETHRTQRVAWPDIRHPAWGAVTARIAEAVHPEAGWLVCQDRRWTADPTRLNRRALRHVDQFLHHQCLELLAYRELGEALRESGAAPPFEIQHSMTAQQPGKKAHEVDVVAVCGYQFLAISCSFDTKSYAKLKAFEVIHRARQVGGSHARALAICNIEPEYAERTTEELRDDVASPEYYVEIWGRDVIADPALLRERLNRYLTERLDWRPRPQGAAA